MYKESIGTSNILPAYPMWKVNMLPPFVGKNHFRRSKFSINTCISFKYRTNWVKQSGIKFQESACIILGADCDELTFGQI